MNRTGLIIALAIGIVTGLVFTIAPQLDVAIAGLFFVPGEGFPAASSDAANWMRDAATAIIALIAAPAVIVPLMKLWQPQLRMLLSGRASLLLLASLMLGPLLMTNLVFKEHGGRPRPREIVTFGGAHAFMPWWDPRGTCEENCSFTAGEPSGAAWTFAAAALTPPAWRIAAYAGALAFTAGVGLLRMAAGAHFFSDVVFAGVLTFLLIWLLHGLLYRWRSRVTDEAVEAWLGRLGIALQRRLGRAAPSGHSPVGSSAESYSSPQKEPP